nr:Os03g0300801 [Ipomoea trifida]
MASPSPAAAMASRCRSSGGGSPDPGGGLEDIGEIVPGVVERLLQRLSNGSGDQAPDPFRIEIIHLELQMRETAEVVRIESDGDVNERGITDAGFPQCGTALSGIAKQGSFAEGEAIEGITGSNLAGKSTVGIDFRGSNSFGGRK